MYIPIYVYTYIYPYNEWNNNAADITGFPKGRLSGI